MTTLKKGVLWSVGCLGLVFVLSIALSWYSFGHLDADTLWWMGLMFAPLLGGVACMVIQAEGRAKRASKAPETVSKPEIRFEVLSQERR